MPEEERRGVESFSRREAVPVGYPSTELWKFILRREKIPIKLRNYLMGRHFVKEKNKWMKLKKSWMNEQGAEWTAGTIAPFFEPSTTVTKYTKEEVNYFTKVMVNAILDKYAQCYKEFAIEKSDLKPLIRMVEHIIFSNLSASREGIILQSIMPRYEISEIYKPEKEKSRWSFPTIFGR